MLTDMHVLESGGMILLDLPAETTEATRERLDQFIFTENVQVESLADSLAGVWVHGPKGAEVLERTLGLPESAGRSDQPSLASGELRRSAAALAKAERTGPTLSGFADYHHGQFEFQGHPVSVARIDQLGVPGFCVYVERAREQDLVAALTDAGAHAVSAEAIEAARVEAGYPVFGIDMTDDTIPLEAGIEDRAISFSKGCYVGQEVIVRVTTRGGGRVAKKLVRWIADASADIVPLPDSRISSFDKDIGRVTSAAFSPNLNRVVGLGYVHRDHTTSGTEVTVMWNDSLVKAVVQ
jgi:folate-binding protein YgfZ